LGEKQTKLQVESNVSIQKPKVESNFCRTLIIVDAPAREHRKIQLDKCKRLLIAVEGLKAARSVKYEFYTKKNQAPKSAPTTKSP
jgi:hypothetical protein